MHWQRKSVSAYKVEPYYLRPGTAPPRSLPLPRERAWGSNPRPLPCLETRPDRPCPWIQPNPQAPVVSQLSLPVCGHGALPKSPHLPRVLPVGDVDPELEKWVGRWGEVLAPALAFSRVFSSLDTSAPASLACVLRQRAPGTLRKHWSGWRHWTRYAIAHQRQSFQPKLKDVVCFLRDLAESRVSGKSVLSAMKFAAGILQLDDLKAHLESPVIAAWCSAGCRRRARKEALPLPLCSVAALEQAVFCGACNGLR